jgi:hypothetical protein
MRQFICDEGDFLVIGGQLQVTVLELSGNEVVLRVDESAEGAGSRMADRKKNSRRRRVLPVGTNPCRPS